MTKNTGVNPPDLQWIRGSTELLNTSAVATRGVAHNPYHEKLVEGRKYGLNIDAARKTATAYVTLRRPIGEVGQRGVYASTGALEGATREQAIDVLEKVLLDALDDVRALRGNNNPNRSV